MKKIGRRRCRSICKKSAGQIKYIKGMDSGRTCFGGCFFVPDSHIIFEKMHRINKKRNDNALAEKESKWISKR